VINKAIVISIAAACSLFACTSAAPVPADPGPGEELPASVERFVAPTPEMLAAALSGNPAKMQTAAASLTSCPAASTCPAGYGSCTAWSTPAACDSICFESPLCTCPILPEHPDFPNEPCTPDLSVHRGRTTLDSFRVCFNAAQQACTEYKQSVTFSCGC
jgi:hypothetical protein